MKIKLDKTGQSSMSHFLTRILRYFSKNTLQRFQHLCYPKHMEKTVSIWTDGACSMPNRNGGYAAILRWQFFEKEFSEGQLHTTNNQMELMAVILGLNKLKQKVHVVLYTDSQYVINGIRSWMPNWKTRNWRTGEGKPVKNVELWKRIDELIVQKTLSIKTVWVRGHSGDEMNDRVNDLAQAARDAVKARALNRMKMYEQGMKWT